MRTRIVPASHDHVAALAAGLRPADVAELAVTKDDPVSALHESIEVSDPDMRWTCLLDETPIAMFGAARLNDGVGVAWLLTHNRFDEVKREVWRHSVAYVSVMHTRYRKLTNYVDDRNVVSHRWLRKLGFRPDAAVVINGFPHTQFTSSRNV